MKHLLQVLVLFPLFATLLPSRACAAEGALPASTGKVAIEGALAVSFDDPATGTIVNLYFSVTPLEKVAPLCLDLELPDGIEKVEGALSRTYESVEAGATVTWTVPVRMAKPGAKKIFGRAVLAESAASTRARGFVVALGKD